MAETAMAETTQGARQSSGKSARLTARDAAAGAEVPGGAGNQLLGSGNALGSALTDTLGADLGYGVDGKTVIPIMGRDYIFAPVSAEDHDEAAADVERIDTVLLAFGMVKPLSKASEITPQDLAAMLRVLVGKPDISELAACVNIAQLFFTMGKEQRHALCRLFWYSFRRWDDTIEFQQVLRIVDYSNMPILLRLWFRKNLGVLDRFLQRLSELVPAAPETSANDLPTETQEPITEEEIKRLLSGSPEEDAPQDMIAEPQTEEPPTTPEAIIAAAQ